MISRRLPSVVPVALCAILILSGCGDDGSTPGDGSTDAGGSGQDAGAADADSGSSTPDGGASSDTGVADDAGAQADAAGDSGVSDAGTPDSGALDTGVSLAPPSCEGLPATCGATGDADCCETISLTGTTFRLGQDNGEPDYYEPVFRTERAVDASVSDFRLDRFEVTVGRFRRYVQEGAPLPAVGSGKHVHLNGGSGLVNEMGWNDMGTMPDDLTLDPTCLNHADATWTDTVGANENKPITCVNWWHAYAFCIWDGGFLPTEAEWEFAASGAEDRFFPWSSPPAQSMFEVGRACAADCNEPVDVGYSPTGDARWGHADMSGNVYEWVLDQYSALYTDPCNDCLQDPDTTARIIRGGAYLEADLNARAAARLTAAIRTHSPKIGIRCARVPE